MALNPLCDIWCCIGGLPFEVYMCWGRYVKEVLKWTNWLWVPGKPYVASPWVFDSFFFVLSDPISMKYRITWCAFDFNCHKGISTWSFFRILIWKEVRNACDTRIAWTCGLTCMFHVLNSSFQTHEKNVHVTEREYYQLVASLHACFSFSLSSLQGKLSKTRNFGYVILI